MPKKKEENEVILEKGKQNTLKTLSKVLHVFVIIARVCLMIGLVAVVILAVITPFVMKDVTINREEISFKNYKIELRENDNEEIDIYYHNSKIAELDKTDKELIIDILDHYDAKRVTAMVETVLMAAIIEIVLSYIILGYLAKILKNINEKDTPFIEENASLIRRIAYFMIATLVASVICSGALSLVAAGRMNISYDFIDIGEIMIVFILSYIFEYGYKLQEKTNAKIYD